MPCPSGRSDVQPAIAQSWRARPPLPHGNVRRQPVRIIALALACGVALAALGTPAPVHAAGQEKSAAPDTSGMNATITLTTPRLQRKDRAALKQFAKRITTARRSTFTLGEVDIDVYVNPAANDYDRDVATNLSNEVARRLLAYGVPRERIERAVKGQERQQTRRGTWDVELRALPASRADAPRPATQ